ncbi:MAG: DUF3445 domain-containing protein [Piscinibacter sp.]|uniref:heme-dependent oxidative N-demethylase subunit alpha family protein n=1 Tax=Piscinibacter sp. TaxID=1903157 RepID=UPI00258E8327|nr:heme-dependent oxidative N-demethylase subunit alpha family protein [Piscinibacter sp.]MCW5664102.1 DUF3445 domain-containing protein [Piscinibacter sp.]
MPFDFAAVAVPFRMQPGLRRLPTGAAQLTPNRPGDAALAAKLKVLQHHADEALLQVPGFDAAPMLARLEAHAAQEHPQALACSAQELAAPLLGWSLRGEAVHGDGDPFIGAVLQALPPPWRRAGLLALAFAEDFAILDGAGATIPWLAVCLPSHWSPRQKVGRHFAEVHAPVADNRVLLAASDHLARLVTGAERWERFVWTVSSDGALDHHPARTVLPPWPADADAAALVAQAWFRTERQTFIPAPELGQAVFTIHVEARPLAEAISTTEQAARLHEAIASMSAAVLAYRGLTDARERLLAWLAAWR